MTDSYNAFAAQGGQLPVAGRGFGDGDLAADPTGRNAGGVSLRRSWLTITKLSKFGNPGGSRLMFRQLNECAAPLMSCNPSATELKRLMDAIAQIEVIDLSERPVQLDKIA
jgi:hypothetical protein